MSDVVEITRTPLRSAVVAAVLAFAFFHFADLTADPDVWGHVLFGYRTLAGGVEKAEPFSWTAPGYPWINHEVLAEAALAVSHRVAGARGLWILTVTMGLATTGLSWRMARRDVTEDVWWLPALLTLPACIQIAFGFAPRPQIFTALFLILELRILQALHEGRFRHALWLPALVALWINTHGGALAGVVLMAAAAAATMAESLWRRRTSSDRMLLCAGLALSVAFVLSVLCLGLNPWGIHLVRWLVDSVRWVRPEIAEWNPTPLGLEHLPFFLLLALTVIAFAQDRLRNPGWWRWAVLGLLAVMGLRHVRHTALFAIAALALLPPYLQAAARGLMERVLSVRDLMRKPMAAVVLGLASALLVAMSFGFFTNRTTTLKVPLNQYPMSAVQLLQQTGIQGNLLCFFDWGELALWELPGLHVSVDGRLDTCYPRDVLDGHWSIYRGETNSLHAVDVSHADVALLRQGLPGTPALAVQPGWTILYADPLAVVLVRDAQRFAGLKSLKLPVVHGQEALTGWLPFPDQRPVRADR